MPDPQDLQLAVLASQGDMEAFEKLVSIYYKGIVGTCYSVTLNTQDAEDCTQEAFIKAYNNIHKYNRKSSFFTWIYRIAMNTCYDLLRKKRRQRTISIDETPCNPESTRSMQIPDSQSGVDDEVIHRYSDQRVRQILAALPEKYSRILTMKDIADLNYNQIAHIENIKIGTVKSRLSRAREMFAKHVKEEDLYTD